MHRYRGGQGFESLKSLDFFSRFLFVTAEVASVTAMVFFHIILRLAVHDFHLFTTSMI